MKLPELFKIKKTRWFDKDGNRVKATTRGARKKLEKSKDWYADIPAIESPQERIDRRRHGQKKRERTRVKLCQNKRAAKEMLRQIIEAAEKEAAGIVDYMSITQQSLGKLLDRYRDHLQSKGDSAEYVELVFARIETIFDGCRFVKLGDLNAEAVANWLHKQRQEQVVQTYQVRGTAKSYREIADKFNVKERTVTYWKQHGAPIVPRGKTNLSELSSWYNARTSRSMGAATSNHYVTAMRGFGKWLVKKAKATRDNPFEFLEKIDAGTDVRKARRVLDSSDFSKLIESAQRSNRMFRELSGTDRAMIYLLAANTGLRASEIASLGRDSFHFDSQPAFVVVSAAYTKNSKYAKLPLREDLVDSFRSYLENLDSTRVVWPGTWSDDGAEMIRVDLAEAEIEYSDSEGRDFDFHALRHQFITDLGKAGVPLVATQKLARHSKPELTANVYTHLSLQDNAAAVEKLARTPIAKLLTGNCQPEGDFGPAHGPAEKADWADLSREPTNLENLLAQEKSPENTVFPGVFGSDADGTRTRNLRIDSRKYRGLLTRKTR